MACIDAKGVIYLVVANNNAAPITLPAGIQVNVLDEADWLSISPGLFNSGGVSGNGNIGIRIYRGLIEPGQPGQVLTSYTPPPEAPEWSGNAVTQSVIPWGKPLQFFIEIVGIASIPTGSTFELTFNPFNVGD